MKSTTDFEKEKSHTLVRSEMARNDLLLLLVDEFYLQKKFIPMAMQREILSAAFYNCINDFSTTASK